MTTVRDSLFVLFVATMAPLGGCASGRLLPDASIAAETEFADFDAARTAFETIEVYRTTVNDLKVLGFDTASPNVRLIGYPDVVARLAPNSSLGLDQLDPGIRDCILARLGCRAYEYRVATETRERTGAFALDWLNFKRTTEVRGWQFDAIVAVREAWFCFATTAVRRTTRAPNARSIRSDRSRVSGTRSRERC